MTLGYGKHVRSPKVSWLKFKLFQKHTWGLTAQLILKGTFPLFRGQYCPHSRDCLVGAGLASLNSNGVTYFSIQCAESDSAPSSILFINRKFFPPLALFYSKSRFKKIMHPFGHFHDSVFGFHHAAAKNVNSLRGCWDKKHKQHHFDYPWLVCIQ